MISSAQYQSENLHFMQERPKCFMPIFKIKQKFNNLK